MLTIVKGRTFSFDATIYDTYVAEGDPGNVPTNHTGWTIRSQIRKKIGNVLVANLNVTFPVPTAGTVAIRHDRVFTRSLPVGDYWWDIVATDPSGIDHDYIEPEPIAVHDHPTDPANSTYDFVPGGGGAISHTHSISDITGLQALLDDRLPPDGGSIARYLRGDNTWQLLNKAAVGLGNVENVTLSTWVGSSNITRLGTIISGAWQGSRIAPAYLGDGTSIETKFLRGDGTWQTISGGGGASAYIDLTDAASVNLPAVNTPLATALAGKAPSSGISPSAIAGTAVITTDPRLSDARTPTAHTHPASEISDSTATGRAVLTAATQSDARTTGLGSGATGDALFQALTPAAAREVALNEILKYDATAQPTQTNPPAWVSDTVLTNVNLTEGLWEISYFFRFDLGTCGLTLRLSFGTPANVDLVGGNNYGTYLRSNQSIANNAYSSATGTLSLVGVSVGTALSSYHYVGSATVLVTGNTTLMLEYARSASGVVGQTITRLGGVFLRARRVNG